MSRLDELKNQLGDDTDLQAKVEECMKDLDEHLHEDETTENQAKPPPQSQDSEQAQRAQEEEKAN